ncbi:MAG: lamin tail domain-containing protein, partial [Gaiellaceae bacterium]
MLAVVFVLAALVGVVGAAQPLAVSPNVVVSQVYGGGGNAGAPFTHDFVELFNRGSASVNLTGWSIQYASATGTGNFGGTTAQITPLSGSIAPGQYVLVQEASNAAVGAPLPTPDITDASPILMAAGAGKVALVNTATPLGCNGGSTPCSPAQLAQTVDLVGYGGANFFEGTGPAPAPSNTTAALRSGGGCVETDDNVADFTAAAPAPRNTASPLAPCTTDQAPAVSSTTPASGAVNIAPAANVTVTFSEPVNVSGSWFDVTCATSAAHTAGASGGPTSFTLNPDTDFAAGESCTVTVVATQVADQDADDPPDQMAANHVFAFTTTALPTTPIHDVQGSAHRSPLAGTTVNTQGVVTARVANGFYVQDPVPDASPATSEGIFVFTNTSPTVSVGDAVQVVGSVAEFRPGGSDSANLSTTELTSPSLAVLSSGNPLPAPTVIGTGGRVPPSAVIDDDATEDVETSGTFDAALDGIDFWESLEGMFLQLNDAVAVGPRSG